MTVVRTYERFSHTSAWVLGAIDLFAAARVTKKEVPPVLGDVNFFITRRLTAPAAVYDPPLELVSATNASGFFLFSGEVRTPDRPQRVALGRGRYRLRVESDYYQTIETPSDEFPNELDWPPPELEDQTIHNKAKDLRLIPGPAYPFPEPQLDPRDLVVTLLRGSLFDAGGAPVSDVEIELTKPKLNPNPDPAKARFQEFTKCKTNKRGEWVISFIETKRAEQGDQLPDFAQSELKVRLPAGEYTLKPKIEPGRDNSVRQTALRGRVARPGGIGFPGVKITTSVDPRAAVSRSDGQWFFYFKLQTGNESDVTVKATSPGGQAVDVQTKIKPGATVVVPAIELS